MIDFDTFQVQISKRISTIEKQIRELFLRLNNAFIPSSGWIASTSAWTYSSVDGPTGVINTSADETGNIQVGDRISYDQTTTQYAIVTAISATQITAYHGTDYALINAAITNPRYSHVKNPLGFPTNPAKWTVEVVNGTTYIKTGPVAGTFYGQTNTMDGGVTLPSLSIPIGLWKVTFKSQSRAEAAIGSTFSRIDVCISTSLVASSDADLYQVVSFNPGAATTAVVVINLPLACIPKALSLAAKTTYYLLVTSPSATMNSLTVQGATGSTVIRAECAYL